jgi:hypothetical protein
LDWIRVSLVLIFTSVNAYTRFVYLYFTVIETKGKNGLPRPLEEIAALFDGEQAIENLRHEAADPADEKNMTGSGLPEAGYGDKKLDTNEVHIEDSTRRL